MGPGFRPKVRGAGPPAPPLDPPPDNLRQKLYCHIPENDANFVNLTDHEGTFYLQRLDNDNTSQVIANLIFQKRV